MKNIGAGVDDIFTQVKKEEAEEVGEVGSRGEEDKYEEKEEYIKMKNNMFFYLKEDSTYRISAAGVWYENIAGEVVGDADTYFRHITNGGRCEGVRDCFLGWTEQDEEVDKKWETLCQHIEGLDGLEQIICDEKSFGV